MFTHFKLSHYIGKYYHASAPMYNIKAYAKQFEEWLGVKDAKTLAGLAFANSYSEGLIDVDKVTEDGFDALVAGLNTSIAALESIDDDENIRTQIHYLEAAEARLHPYLLVRPRFAEILIKRDLTGSRY